VYRPKNKKMNGDSVHLMQLLYTLFPHLSSENPIKMVDFSKKVPFSSFSSSNPRPSPTHSRPAYSLFLPLSRRIPGRIDRTRTFGKNTNDDQIGRFYMPLCSIPAGGRKVCRGVFLKQNDSPMAVAVVNDAFFLFIARNFQKKRQTV